MQDRDFIEVMASLTFCDGLNRIEWAFHSAAAAMEDHRNGADDILNRAISNRADYPDAGSRWEEMKLALDSQEISLANDALCESFIITAYHFWEKTVRGLTGVAKGADFEKMHKKMRARYSVHSRIEAVKEMVNLLKHDNEDRACALDKLWPEAFSERPYKSGKSGRWHWRLNMSRSLVDEVINIVRLSGPPALSNPLMRIVSWNCNGALRKKFERIATLDADIYVIQECEDPATSTPAYREWAGAYLWAGNAASKGMGVFAKNGHSIEALDWSNHGLQQFLPVRVDDRLNLIAVWTKNDARMAYIGQFWQYLEHHSGSFDANTVICGDLNSNAIWDKRGRVWNHSECVAVLERQGFRSLYHLSTGERQGEETRPTLYLQRNLAKPYHIDYFFAHDDAFANGPPEIKVGTAEEWLSISDHMPVVAKLG